MRRVRNRLSQLFLTLVLILVVFGIGTRIVSAEETEGDAQEIREETENALMSEFDFEEIENSLSGMFPQQKISFEEVLSELITGNWSGLGKTFLGYLSDRIFYEFRYNRENLVYMLMVALTAAVFTNFSSAFQNRQVSEISFYVLYMLLITLCLTAFRVAAQGLEENLDALVDFMRVLCPSYFLAVAFASGSVTSLFFYNVILVLIYVVELVLVRFLLPVINVYIMIQVLGNLTGEDFLSEFAQLLQKLVSWILKSLLAGVVGINVVQGLLAPVIDSLRKSALTRTAEALPWIGNAVGGAAEIVLGTAVLIKNGIGMAGAVIAVVICAVPVIQMLILAFLYKLAAALVQPVSDKRITGCISSVSEGYELLLKVVFTAGVLFLLTIAIVAASTT
ncbi:stage III sporulation protein AE [Mediterraneibacter glycyrrhizinilyticus]|uniref:stage III sporulation protein AE n=1 Tax=Mediterraneibacter glycyrrhizinilyticus TaxID=342942 RepID=UPI00195FA3A3|nr:stage III sporulation protein AE [Mediterraneibacter glycyrrhizinilyticus]MBM6751296.1 stage III sporulation protein AE [Mediterraneibacter glycyrrhizinilyticus]